MRKPRRHEFGAIASGKDKRDAPPGEDIGYWKNQFAGKIDVKYRAREIFIFDRFTCLRQRGIGPGNGMSKVHDELLDHECNKRLVLDQKDGRFGLWWLDRDFRLARSRTVHHLRDLERAVEAVAVPFEMGESAKLRLDAEIDHLRSEAPARRRPHARHAAFAP